MGRNSIHKIKRPPRHSQIAMAVRIESEEDLFEQLGSEERPIVLALEGVQDPHNLGACLRTASGAGVAAVIAPVKGSCGLTPTVRDVSCGGADEVPFLKVRNLNATLRKFRELGFHLVGTSDHATDSLYAIDFRRPIVLVLGGEGWGIRKITASNCDQLVSIPMLGGVDCLNVSVSAGVCLYEAVRQRL